MFKVIKDLSQWWYTDFNAFDFSTCSLFKNLFKVNISWIDACISKSMENCSWNSVRYPFSWVLNFFWLWCIIEWSLVMFFILVCIQSALHEVFEEWTLVMLIFLHGKFFYQMRILSIILDFIIPPFLNWTFIFGTRLSWIDLEIINTISIFIEHFKHAPSKSVGTYIFKSWVLVAIRAFNMIVLMSLC